MRIKLITVICLILIASWFFKENKQRSSSNNEKQELVDTSDHPEVMAAKPVNKSNASTATEQMDEVKIDYSPEQLQVINEITPYEFSSDPYVELLSMEWTVGTCIVDDYVRLFFTQHQVNNPSVNDYLSEVQNHCHQLKQRYPNLISKFQNNQARDLFEPQSELGHLLKSNDQDLSKTERDVVYKKTLRTIIKTQNSGLLLTDAMTRRWGAGVSDDILLHLSTQDHNYARTVSYMALNLLTCEFSAGESCARVSTLMLVACQETPFACGQDYISWYQQNTLPGMQRDVEKLMSYYQQSALK